MFEILLALLLPVLLFTIGITVVYILLSPFYYMVSYISFYKEIVKNKYIVANFLKIYKLIDKQDSRYTLHIFESYSNWQRYVAYKKVPVLFGLVGYVMFRYWELFHPLFTIFERRKVRVQEAESNKITKEYIDDRIK